MRSFGLWYKELENITKDDSFKEPTFDLHINFWSLEHIRTKENVVIPYLDIGINIHNFRSVEKVVFYCPFAVPKDNISDLSDKMLIRENAANIFNQECSVLNTDPNKYSILIVREFEDKDIKYIVYPFDQANQLGGVDAVTYACFNGQSGGGSKADDDIDHITFSLQRMIGKLGDSDYDDAESVYIRFRIKADLLKNLYFDSEPLNKSFESAFAASRIIDFQVNKKRSIDPTIKSRLSDEKLIWPEFSSVHFLLMEPTSHIVDILSLPESVTCRNLEAGIWNDYLENAFEYDSDDILAYHLKEKKKQTDYSCLIRVNYSKTKQTTIIAYCIGVIALGMLGSVLSTIIFEVIEMMNIPWVENHQFLSAIIISIVSFAVLMGISLFINRTKK